MIKSFRLRITVWYTGLFSLLMVLFGIFLYGMLARGLAQRVDETISSEADTAVALLQDEMVEENGDVAKAATEAVSGMRLRGSSVAVLAGGRLLAASAPAPPGEFEAAAARVGGERAPRLVLVTLHRPGKAGARAAARPIAIAGTSFIIVAVEPLDPIAADLALVRRVLYIGLPLLLALAALGGYWLTTRSLAPLKWMAEQAREITGSSLHKRLDIGDAAEELAVLSASFNELLARLDQSFESMRRFVADASHELRTPISVIRGEADVALSHERGSAEYREALAIVLDESRRLSRLVDDLLNLARADAGNVRLQVQEFYLNDLLAECCRSVQSLAGGRRIELECRAGEDAPFRGDEELLRRLVLNLLDNAIRYTPPGGKVTASLDAAGPEARLRVSDTGSGIAPEAAPLVFERFFRAEKSRSRQEGGFGLGLSIVKWIAEAHHGTVELESRPGDGAAFTVRLPRGPVSPSGQVVSTS
jgi:two-component system OmpR family sensor kinase